MRTRDFLMLYVGSNRLAIRSEINGWCYPDYMRLAKLTALYDYGCNFDSTELCSRYRNPPSEYGCPDKPSLKYKMCCCSACRTCFGYLKVIPNYLDIIRIYAKCFNDETGFWKKGVGCRLPREYRSSTCLTYQCHPNQYTPKSVQRLFRDLKQRPKELRIHGRYLPATYQYISVLEEWIKSETSKKG